MGTIQKKPTETLFLAIQSHYLLESEPLSKAPSNPQPHTIPSE